MADATAEDAVRTADEVYRRLEELVAAAATGALRAVKVPNL